jgi:hypothetical protein
MADELVEAEEHTELVRATELGHYLRLREPGEEFQIPKRLFAAQWMEYVVPEIDSVSTPADPPQIIENQDVPDPTLEAVTKKKGKKE